MMKYRVFVEDIGPGRYSAYCDKTAASAAEAIARTARWTSADPLMLIALPFRRKELWPDSTTGRVTKEAIREGRKA